jgi:uncharacterized 2Fe-2S/4Fe-4S cluster protein (DUF4445 family)
MIPEIGYVLNVNAGYNYLSSKKMAKLGIALDLGTSGFRGLAIDPEQSGIILSIEVITRHPLSGAKAIDNFHFALDGGTDLP